MFEDGYMSPSGVRIFTSLAHNITGADVKDGSNPQIQDLIRKWGSRGREILSERSEDSLTFSAFHSLQKLPAAARSSWLQDFFRAAFGDRTAAAYAPYADQAVVRFWQPHHSPQVYLEYLAKKVSREGESALQHLEYGDRLKAKRRLERLLAGDIAWGEMPTETDVQITIPAGPNGSRGLVLFCEVKLYGDISRAGTLNGTDNRNQLLRNLEMVWEAKERMGFDDARLVLLTLDRTPDRFYSQMFRRYRSTDPRKLRAWDVVTEGWENIRKDLPHRNESPEWYQRLNTSLGWITWPEMMKATLAAYAEAFLGESSERTQ